MLRSPSRRGPAPGLAAHGDSVPDLPYQTVRLLGCLTPGLLLGWDAFTGGLGVNPIEDVTHRTGDWALRLLLVTLAVTPLRRLAGWMRSSGSAGCWGSSAFFYATLHFSTYLVFDHFFDLLLIIDDVAERRYVTAGFVGFVLMVPLAVTSTQGWIRRLGKRWTALHRLVYASAVAGVVHFLWLVKIDIGEPLIYAAILAVLFGARMAHRYRGHGGAVRTKPGGRRAIRDFLTAGTRNPWFGSCSAGVRAAVRWYYDTSSAAARVSSRRGGGRRSRSWCGSRFAGPVSYHRSPGKESAVLGSCWGGRLSGRTARQRTVRFCSGRFAGRLTRPSGGAVPATWDAM